MRPRRNAMSTRPPRAPLVVLFALPVFALASSHGAAGAAGDFVSTSICGDGPGPACYVEYTCVEWGLRFYPAFPPTDMLVCERWAVTDVRYWTEGGDGSGGPTGGEDAPVAPEEDAEALG